MNALLQRISDIGIVPVVKITDPDDALPLAEALCDGGIDVMEITFRTAYATQAIKAIHEAYPDIVLGAGTVSDVKQAEEAVKAGASFIVTPGFNERVVAWAIEHEITILPGVSTASEIETALTYGLDTLKFFPAESSGGWQKLKDLSAPYPQVKFLPTGGINENNMHSYLQLSNVIAIGGSFMLDQSAIAEKNWYHIRVATSQAVKTMLGYELIHIGINNDSQKTAIENTKRLCELFHFPLYSKPKSLFAGKGFELMKQPGPGKHGHIGIYTPYPQRAMYHLAKKGISFIEDSITRNKVTNQINFVYLDMELAGFAIHLINPDVKM